MLMLLTYDFIFDILSNNLCSTFSNLLIHKENSKAVDMQFCGVCSDMITITANEWT